MNSLSSLAIGDEVAIRNWRYTASYVEWSTIVKLTKTQLTVADGRRFMLSTGRQLGLDPWHEVRACPLTTADIATIATQERNAAKAKMKECIYKSLSRATIEQLTAAYEILKSDDNRQENMK